MKRAALTVAVALLAGCPWGTMSSDELDAAYPYNKGRMFSRGVAAGAAKALRARLGADVRVMNVSLSPRSAVFTVQDGKAPDRLDNWLYQDGAFRAPQPIQRSEHDEYEVKTFALDGIAFDRVHEMIARALRELKIEQATAQGVYVSVGSDGPQIRVDVSGPRRTGFARFSTKGELVEAKVN